MKVLSAQAMADLDLREKKALDTNPSKKYIFLEDYGDIKKNTILNGKENSYGATTFTKEPNKIPTSLTDSKYLITIPKGYYGIKLLDNQNSVNSEPFLQKHKNHLLIAVALVAGYFAYKKFKK